MKQLVRLKLFECDSLAGISGVNKGFIPYIKSASKQRYIREKDEWFVRWDEETIKYYNNNKKSRFKTLVSILKQVQEIPWLNRALFEPF